MKSKLAYSLIVAASCIAASGCGGGDDQKQEVHADHSYEQAGCQYEYDQGGAIDSSAMAAQDIESVYFGKRINLSPIKALMPASAKATVEFEDTQGVHVYGIPTPGTKCAMFSGVEIAPKDFPDYWTQSSGGVGSDMTLVGLFAPAGTAGVASAKDVPEIGIRQDAYRWVVVHEFMHFQFNLRATEAGRTVPQLLSDVDSHIADYNSALHGYDGSTDTLVKVIDTFLPASRDVRELLVRFPLEEVSIETFLQTNYSKFSYMPELIKSSNDYIKQSADKARSMVSDFEDRAGKLIDLAQSKGIPTDDLSNELTAHKNLASQVDQTTRLTSADAVNLAADGVSVDGGPAIGCAHDQGVNERLNRIAKILEKDL